MDISDDSDLDDTRKCDWYRKYLSTEEFHPYSENCKECDLMLNQVMTNPSGRKK